MKNVTFFTGHITYDKDKDLKASALNCVPKDCNQIVGEGGH